ncbi:hypothetical protein T01_14130 [Trichinella spiralis]|uniref:Uncharacterized protein n=1 Tax=Trichinella spiralis TaxID=6334 RepID=A0A0V1BTW4_TRISP|nr:hypothetical protein T01_14130 [Trichinella spiralis]
MVHSNVKERFTNKTAAYSQSSFSHSFNYHNSSMSSLSQLSSTVKQVDEDSTEQFITQLIINVEEHILLHHVNKLLALPMIQHIIQIPTPEPSGQIKKGFAETCYSTAGIIR